VTSTDRVQVTTVALRLGRLIEALNPVTLLGTVSAAAEMVTEPPPGDPARLRQLAAAFATAGAATVPVAAGVRDVGTRALPDVWQGGAGATAGQVITATADLVGATEPAFTLAARALTEYADTVEDLRRRHADLHQRLREAWHDATHVTVLGREIAVPDVTALDDLVRRVAELLDGCRRLCTESLSAADILAGRFADVAGRARATSMRRASGSAAGAVVLADVGPSGDAPILTAVQAERAAVRLAGLSPGDRARMDAALAAAESPQQRAYILKAFAAGHNVGKVVAFATGIRGKDPDWLRRHLSLVDPSTTGPVTYEGAPVGQVDGTTCGSTSILMARAMADPLYTLYLTTGGGTDDRLADRDSFLARMAAEEQRIHDTTNVVWPQSLGTSPWGVSDELNRHADAMGTGFDWRLVDDTSAGSVDPALRDAVTAVDGGRPVPVLIGDQVPRHYVLMVGHDGSDLLFYDPSAAAVVRVSEQDFRNGTMRTLGFSHVQAVITPSS
jgi:hypothetical protein